MRYTLRDENGNDVAILRVDIDGTTFKSGYQNFTFRVNGKYVGTNHLGCSVWADPYELGMRPHLVFRTME